MVRGLGYSVGPDHFRHLMAHYRPRPEPDAYLRLKTVPGERAQVDWGYAELDIAPNHPGRAPASPSPI